MNNWQIVIYFCVSAVSPEHCNETTASEISRPLETTPPGKYDASSFGLSSTGRLLNSWSAP